VTDILLLDDHAVVRESLAQVLSQVAGLEVVGQAGSVAEAKILLRGRVTGDGTGTVLICDVSLPDGSGLAVARRARSRYPQLGIVVLTMHEDDATLLAARDCGASALLSKSEPADHLVAAVHEAARHPTHFTAAGLGDAERRSRDAAKVVLTPREAQVMSLIATGSSISQVAADLFMSESTAKTHVAKIYSKLGVHNRASAVMAAIRLGLIDGEGL